MVADEFVGLGYLLDDDFEFEVVVGRAVFYVFKFFVDGVKVLVYLVKSFINMDEIFSEL